jgi:hypothetical protein
MAPPPAHLIFRKVAKDYLRRIMTYELRDTAILQARMDQAEQVFGDQSEQYKTLATQYETLLRMEESYRGYVYKQKMHKQVVSLLAAPKRKKEDKNGHKAFWVHSRRFDLRGLT